EALPSPITSKDLAKDIIDKCMKPYEQNLEINQQLYLTPQEKERLELMKRIHAFGHHGANEMVTQIQKKGFHWPYMKQDCVQWIRSCKPCQHYNITQKGYHPLQA